jgi:hypothetical protein
MDRPDVVLRESAGGAATSSGAGIDGLHAARTTVETMVVRETVIRRRSMGGSYDIAGSGVQGVQGFRVPGFKGFKVQGFTIDAGLVDFS